MIASLKSDFRKMFTVRSTYLMLVIAFGLTGLISFYFKGYKANTDPGVILTDASVSSLLTICATFVSLFISLISILLMAHEYRYNTIMYTLTANASRTQVWLSKVVTVALFSLGVGLISSLFAYGAFRLGLSLHSIALPAQSIDVIPELSRISLFYMTYGLIGLFIALILRSLVGSIAFFFVYPTIVEQLIGGLLLKSSDAYLPFKAFSGIIGMSGSMNPLSLNKACIVSATYLVVIGAVSWVQFLKRDVN